MKRVLLALKQNRRELESVILRGAKERGWLVETFSHRIPAHWVGDGVLADYPDEADIKQADLSPDIPWVTRYYSCGVNWHGSVEGDTKVIAQMIANYFENRGYRHYATFEVSCLTVDSSTPFRNPPLECALCNELEFRSLKLHIFYWTDHGVPSIWSNYSRAVEKLRIFLRSLPRPCAIFCPNLDYLPIFYYACSCEGILIPQEFAPLVVNDEESITCSTIPTTSAIAGEFESLGVKMMDMLERMMDGQAGGYEISTPLQIKTRQSTDILAVENIEVATVIQFFNAHYMEPITVADGARHAGLSVRNMNYLFRRHLPYRPLQLLNEIRMNKIRELLIATDLSLSEIAASCGYGSNMSLSLAFKKQHGTTPGAFREQNRR